MDFTYREWATVLHGMVFGALYLLAFAGGFADLWSLQPHLLTAEGLRERLKRLYVGSFAMAAVCWGAVLYGTYVVYPWYREGIPTSPRSILMANPHLSEWHTFGMEWKEHIGWVAPILTTAIAFIICYYGEELTKRTGVRRLLLTVFCIAFIAAGIAGVLGAFITKIVPLQ